MEPYQKELELIKKVLKDNPKGMTITDISREVNINRNSVSKYLEILLISGHVEMRTYGPAKVFSLSQRVPISAMLNFSSDYALILNRDLRIVYVNNNFLNFMNIEREVLLGRRIEDSSLPLLTSPEMISNIKEGLEGKESALEINVTMAEVDFYFKVKVIPTTFDDGGQGVTIILENITEHMRAEKALRESEAKYSALVEQANDAVVIFQDEVFKFANKAAADISGYAVEEIVGMHVFDLLIPELREPSAQRYERRMLGEEIPLTFETKIKCKDGTIKDAEISSGTIQYDGRPATMGIGRDITERKRMEEELKRYSEHLEELVEERTGKLRESEERFRGIAERSFDAIFTMDLEGRFTYLSPSAERIIGHKAEEMVGRSFQEFVPESEIPSAVHTFSGVLKGENVEAFQAEMLRKDGIPVFGEINASPIIKEGEIVGIQGIVSDITERKMMDEELKGSEERYRTLVENANQTITVITEGVITYANTKAEELTGYTKEEFLGKSLAEIIHSDDLDAAMERYRTRLKGGELSHLFSSRIVTKEGDVKWVEVNAVLIEWNEKPSVLNFTTDITERKRMEEEIRKSEERWRSLVELAPEGIITMNMRGVITSINTAFEGLTGYSENEIVGKHFTKLRTLRARDIPNYVRLFNSIIRGKKPSPFEFVYYHKDGTSKWGEGHFSLIKIGEKREVLGVLGEITQRKEVEEKLMKSEERYRTFLESSRDAIFVLDSTKYIYANTQAAELLGFSDPQELIGRDAFEFIAPEDREKVKSMTLARQRGEEPPSRYEFKMIGRDGAPVHVEVNASLIELDGKPVSLAINRDITERKKAEDRIRFLVEILESSTISVITTDESGSILYVNPATEKLFGYEKDELIGKNPMILNAEPDADRIQREIFDTALRGEVWRGELLNRKKNGETFYIHTSVYQLADEEGNLISLVGFQEDITERKKAEEELQASEQRYRRLIEDAAIPIGVSDLTGRFTYVNKTLAELGGYTVEEMVGRHFKDFLHPEDRDKILAEWVRGLSDPKYEKDLEFRVLGKDGKVLHMMSKPTRIMRDGKTVGFQAMMIDLTERKRMEQEIRKSEERWRSLVELAPEGITTMNMKGVITSVNTAFLKRTGYSRDEILGKHFSKLETIRAKDLPKYLKMFGSALRGKIPPSLEFEYKHKDGTLRWAEGHFSLIKIGGKREILAVLSEITQRKRMEEELRIKESALASSINAVALADLEGNLTYVNNSFLKLWGYDDQEEILGKPTITFWQMEEKATEVVEALRDKGVWTGELIARRKDGSTFDAHLSANMVVDEAGKPTCMMASFIDITERKHAGAK